MKKIFFLMWAITFYCYGFTQDFSLFEKQVFSNKTGVLAYRILYPLHYNPAQQYPLIVFLHGSGERGSDNETQLKHGGAMFLRDSVRQKYPAIVIFPQCPKDSSWTPLNSYWDSTKNMRIFSGLTGSPTTQLILVKDLMQDFIKRKKVHPKKVYLGGLSLGGFGSFSFAAHYPKLLAAAFPICGGGNTNLANNYTKKTAWWLFHGAMDRVVSVEYSKAFYKKMQGLGIPVKYTEYANAAHDSWNNMFEEKDFFAWLFSKKR
jgi:predicted peptidase